MDTKSLFQRYRARLVRIGVVKSLLVALAAGLTATGLAAFITWFTPLSLVFVLLISLGAGLIVGGIVCPLVYYKFFLPTPEKIARLVDKLGLEERTITMCELQNDESYLSFCQREDAKEKLKDVDERRLRYALSKIVICLTIVACAFAVSFTTVSSLASVGRIQKAYEFIFPDDDDEDEEEKEEEYVNVYYIALENGSIEGETEQHIIKGSNTRTVRAVPDEGYAFLQWSDGILSAERRDWQVMEDLAVEAIFLKPNETDEGDRESEEGQGGEGEDENTSGNEENENADPGSQDSENEDQDGEQGDEGDEPSEDDTEDGENHGATGTEGLNDNNSVIDGATDYESQFDYEQSMEDIENDPSIPDDLKDVLGDYFGSLKP